MGSIPAERLFFLFFFLFKYFYLVFDLCWVSWKKTRIHGEGALVWDKTKRLCRKRRIKVWMPSIFLIEFPPLSSPFHPPYLFSLFFSIKIIDALQLLAISHCHGSDERSRVGAVEVQQSPLFLQLLTISLFSQKLSCIPGQTTTNTR